MTVYLDSFFSRLKTERLPWRAFSWGSVENEMLDMRDEFGSFSNPISNDPKYIFLRVMPS